MDINTICVYYVCYKHKILLSVWFIKTIRKNQHLRNMYNFLQASSQRQASPADLTNVFA